MEDIILGSVFMTFGCGDEHYSDTSLLNKASGITRESNGVSGPHIQDISKRGTFRYCSLL